MMELTCSCCHRTSYTADGSTPKACPLCAEDAARAEAVTETVTQLHAAWAAEGRAIKLIAASEAGEYFLLRAMLAAARAAVDTPVCALSGPGKEAQND